MGTTNILSNMRTFLLILAISVAAIAHSDDALVPEALVEGDVRDVEVIHQPFNTDNLSNKQFKKLMHPLTDAEEKEDHNDDHPPANSKHPMANSKHPMAKEKRRLRRLVAKARAIPSHSAGDVLLDEQGKTIGHFIADDMLIAPHQKAAFDLHGLDSLVQD